MGIHEVNGAGHIFGAKQVSGAKEVGKTDFLNTVFSKQPQKNNENSPFTHEETVTLCKMAYFQDRVMIED